MAVRKRTHTFTMDAMNDLAKRISPVVEGQPKPVVEAALHWAYLFVADGAAPWRADWDGAGAWRMLLAQKRMADAAVQVLREVDALPAADAERLFRAENERVC